jgi:hypothetical protein
MKSNMGSNTKNDHFLFDNKRKKNRSKCVILALSLVLLCICSGSVGILQYINYDIYLENIKEVNVVTNSTYAIEDVIKFVAGGLIGQTICNTLNYWNFDIVPTSIAIGLMLIYTIMSKRRSLLTRQLGCRYLGLPNVISVWAKTDRFYTSIIYGRIAYEIFEILIGRVSGNDGPIFYFDTKIDPSGILPLLMIIVKVLLIGLRKSIS